MGPEITELGFEVEPAVDFVIGSHETTMSVHPWWQPNHDDGGADGVPVTVEVARRGEPQIDLYCGGRVNLDIEITLAFQDPPLDIVFDTTIEILDQSEAVVNVYLDTSLKEELSFLEEAPGEREADSYFLWLSLSSDGVAGDLLELSRHVPCRVAVIPHELRCPILYNRRADTDQTINGFSFENVLENLSRLEPFPITWQEGSTTILHLSLVERPDFLCTRWRFFTQFEQETRVIAEVTLHLKTDDDRIDLVLPARLEAAIASNGDWNQSMRLLIGTVIPFGVIQGDSNHIGSALTEEQVLDLGMSLTVEGDDVTGIIYAFELPLYEGVPQPSEPPGFLEWDDIGCIGDDARGGLDGEIIYTYEATIP